MIDSVGKTNKASIRLKTKSTVHWGSQVRGNSKMASLGEGGYQKW